MGIHNNEWVKVGEVDEPYQKGWVYFVKQIDGKMCMFRCPMRKRNGLKAEMK